MKNKFLHIFNKKLTFQTKSNSKLTKKVQKSQIHKKLLALFKIVTFSNDQKV